MVPVDFLSDAQVGAYGRFVGSVSELDLERFFFLDDDDLMIVGRRRGAANRLGFAVQLGTVRYLGCFLDDPTDVPGNVVEFVSRQLGIAGPTVFEECSVRAKTGYEHSSTLSANHRSITGQTPNRTPEPPTDLQT
jgi:TnpA family transposase